MPRAARIVLPNHPHHVIQRGHNRKTVFIDESDFEFYLNNLAELKEEVPCLVYAYCLMPNHVHLIVDPGSDRENLARLLKPLAQRQARRVNKQRSRSGALWEGRFRSSPIQTDRYLLTCCRYVDLNPVRAELVATPEQYRWSSCKARLGLETIPWLDDDHLLSQLGRNRRNRRIKYRNLLAAGMSTEQLYIIRNAVHQGRLTGDGDFVKAANSQFSRFLGIRRAGRPKKKDGGHSAYEKGDCPGF